MIRRERKQILGVENERSSNPPDSASWFSSTAAHMRKSKRPGTRSSWAVPMLRRRSRRPVRKDLHFKPLFFLTRNKADVPEQRSYLHTWVDGVNSAHFLAGVYCSGIASKEDSGVSIVTAEDIRRNAGGRKINYWIVNDSCPPSPGCTVSRKDLLPESSGLAFADVWQFSQSPKRTDFASGCSATYNKDGNCYPPDV